MSIEPRHVHSFAEAVLKIIEGTDQMVEVGIVPALTDPSFARDARPTFHRVTVAEVKESLQRLGIRGETPARGWTVIDAAVLILIATGKIVAADAYEALCSQEI